MSLCVFPSAGPTQEDVFLRRLFGEKQHMKRRSIGRRNKGIDRLGAFDLITLVGRAQARNRRPAFEPNNSLTQSPHLIR